MSQMKPSGDTLRMLFGFCILFMDFMLGLAIALGHVEEKTSYGLKEVLAALGPLSGMFAQWAFSSTGRKPDGDE